MGARKRKQLLKYADSDTKSAQDTTSNEHESHQSNHADTAKQVQEAIETLSNSLPMNSKLGVRHPSLSRNPSVGNYLHKALFVSEAEAKERLLMAPSARRRVILLLGIIIGMGLAMLLMGQTKDAAYIEAFSHYFQDFDLASMVPTGMIPEEFIGNMSAMFRPDILTEDSFHPGEELREVHGYRPKYPVKIYKSKSSLWIRGL